MLISSAISDVLKLAASRAISAVNREHVMSMECLADWQAEALYLSISLDATLVSNYIQHSDKADVDA